MSGLPPCAGKDDILRTAVVEYAPPAADHVMVWLGTFTCKVEFE